MPCNRTYHTVVEEECKLLEKSWTEIRYTELFILGAIYEAIRNTSANIGTNIGTNIETVTTITFGPLSNAYFLKHLFLLHH